ncbi:RNA polymerase sigma factor [soil metagenome]
MAKNFALATAVDPAPEGARAANADAILRMRLEESLERGYRLATIILSDASEAEDLTHDAIERAWRARSSLREPDRFEAWFQRIIVNACRDRLRRRRSAPVTISVDVGNLRLRDSLASQSLDIPAAMASREALGRALRVLPDDQRIVVVLRFYLDLEIDEIARRTGAPAGTVKARLHRGLRKLRTAWYAGERLEEQRP